VSEVSMFNALIFFFKEGIQKKNEQSCTRRAQSVKSPESLSIRAEFIRTSKGDGDG